MNDLLAPVDQIRASADPTALFSGDRGQSTALKNQIQFSSLMKTFVDTPQETLAAAENNAKPFEFSARSPKYPEQRPDHRTDHQSSFYTEGERRNVEQFNKPSQETAVPTGKVDSLERDNSRTNGLVEQKNKVDRNTPLNADEVARIKDFEKISEYNPSTGLGNKETNQNGLLSALGLANFPLNGTVGKKLGRGIAQQTQTVPNRPNNDPTQILVDNQQIRDLKLISPASNPLQNQRSSALANQQAQDLASKFGRDFYAQINVNVIDAPDKQKINIKQAVAKNTLIVAQGQSSENPLISGTLHQRTAGVTAPDRNGMNLNSSGQNSSRQNANLANQQAAQTNFIQTLQTQSFGAGRGAQTHNSAPKLASVMADTVNITSTTVSTGSSQISQTARANPMPAQPQLSKPPVPMEQISVKIQKAIQQGTDKINIKLHPAHLGRVEVRMDIGRDGQLSAIILAEKPETLDLLQKDVRGLERALQQAGLDTNSNSFNFSLKNNGAQQSAQDRENADGNNQNLSENTGSQTDEADNDSLLENPDQKGGDRLTDNVVDIKV